MKTKSYIHAPFGPCYIRGYDKPSNADCNRFLRKLMFEYGLIVSDSYTANMFTVRNDKTSSGAIIRNAFNAWYDERCSELPVEIPLCRMNTTKS